jgi:hypothetical protein
MLCMHETHFQQVDLNLLHILQALLEERHVTRAGNRCFLSQSAMSRAFERLRVRQRGTGQITGKAKEDEN